MDLMEVEDGLEKMLKIHLKRVQAGLGEGWRCSWRKLTMDLNEVEDDLEEG